MELKDEEVGGDSDAFLECLQGVRGLQGVRTVFVTGKGGVVKKRTALLM